MRFGVNYTPSVGWFHHWLDFDLDPVRADLDSLAELGMDHIRVFPLWPVFQPNRAVVRPRAVEQLVSVVDAAAERGLDVAVDGLQGHLSSFDFRPSWTVTWHRRNLFTDPDVVAGQAHYLRTLAEALADRPNFVGMTLGNEFNQFADRPHPDADLVTSAEAEVWLTRLLSACEEGAPGAFHTHCEYDAVWYQDGHPFTPEHAARIGAATNLHSWVFNGTVQRYGPLSTASVRHAEYQIELAAGWAVDPARPVWLQEVGAPSPHVPAELVGDFAEQTVHNALTCANLWGVTWWCSHDVDRRLVDFPELEYGLGLLTSDRAVKPMAKQVAAAIRDGHRPVRRTTALVLDDAADRSACGPGGAFFDGWMALADKGVRAAVVLGSRVDDTGYLAQRGITDLIDWRERQDAR